MKHSICCATIVLLLTCQTTTGLNKNGHYQEIRKVITEQLSSEIINQEKDLRAMHILQKQSIEKTMRENVMGKKIG